MARTWSGSPTIAAPADGVADEDEADDRPEPAPQPDPAAEADARASAVLADPLADVLPSLAVVTGWIALALVLGSLTLRRRTP